MTATFQRGSAKIYEFPARGCFAPSGNEESTSSAANATSLRAAKIVCGGAWYHEEAVQEAADRGRAST